MKRKQQEEEEEEEEEGGSLIISTSNCKVIEYLEPVMSKELLFKFPDNSAFDFNYSQSSIWSPLVPRNYSPMDLDLIKPRKITLGFDSEWDNKNKCGSCSVANKKKKKMKMAISNLKKTRKREVKASDFSPIPVMGSCFPFADKGWNKVLKAASKHFKRKKKKDPTVHVRLSNYLTDA